MTDYTSGTCLDFSWKVDRAANVPDRKREISVLLYVHKDSKHY